MVIAIDTLYILLLIAVGYLLGGILLYSASVFMCYSINCYWRTLTSEDRAIIKKAFDEMKKAKAQITREVKK